MLWAGDEAAAAEFQLLNGTVGKPLPLADLLSMSQVTGVKIAGAVGALLLGIVWVRIRRLDLALALHLGQPRGARLVQILVEALPIAVLAPALIGVGTVVAVSTQLSPAETSQVAASVLLTSVATVACLLAGIIAAHVTVRSVKFGEWSKDR